MNRRNQILNSNWHLTPSALKSLKDGSLPEDELMLATTHISHCLECAEAFADIFADNELMKAPVGFIEAIEGRLSNKAVKNNKGLFLYSLRVGVAVCASIAMIFFGSLSFHANTDTYTEIIKPPNLRFMQSINMSLRDFSQKLLYMEVFFK